MGQLRLFFPVWWTERKKDAEKWTAPQRRVGHAKQTSIIITKIPKGERFRENAWISNGQVWFINVLFLEEIMHMVYNIWWSQLPFTPFQESSIFFAVLIRYSSRCMVLNPVCASKLPGFFFFNVVPHPYCRPIKLESLGHGMSIDIVYSSSDDFHGSRGWEPLFQINFRTVFQIPKIKQKSWDLIGIILHFINHL